MEILSPTYSHSQGAMEGGKWVWAQRWGLEALQVNALQVPLSYLLSKGQKSLDHKIRGSNAMERWLEMASL